MTEAEWSICTDPTTMLASILPIASDRKLRLFAVACCRRTSNDLLVESKSCRDAVDVGELFADDLATLKNFDRAHGACVHFAGSFAFSHAPAVASYANLKEIVVQVPGMITGAIIELIEENCADPETEAFWRGKIPVERSAQAALLRDIFHDHVFSPPAIEHAWLAWNHDTIPKLAQGIYHDCQFDRLPVLADALEEAGCTNTDILNHCRGEGLHFRGCWVVDLILGKQ